jgi:acetyl esterase/lipase
VLVLIPGGGWSSADRSGLVPLAESLAQAGYAVLNATYRTAGDGVHFPVPVQDVECDAAFAVAQARQRGITPDGVVLIGHSAGGHLAALAAVSGDDFSTGCPYPSVAIDGLVGLAGVYDTAAFDDVVETFFGMPRADDPSRWESGDPLHYVESGQAPDGLHVLLLHGDADSLVPVSQSRQFADALTRAGIDTSYAALPGETHGSLYTAPVAAPRIVTWLRSLPEP